MNQLSSSIQRGDIGFPFEHEFLAEDGSPLDISGASVIEYRFERPDATYLHVAGTFATDGQDGRTVYLSAAGDLNLAGSWRYQVRLVIGAGFERSTAPIAFEVAHNIP